MRALTTLTLAATVVAAAGAQTPGPTNPRAAELQQWGIHDTARRMPPVVNPGPAGPPAPVPADAIVLFDGRDLSGWTNAKGGAPGWVVRDGILEAVKGTGAIRTVGEFGSCQLHIEWATPSPAVGSGQNRGNSGVFLMNTYEVQVLDSFESATYADGMAAALYGQYPPLVNASRGPGHWQTYDIVFHAPRFDAAGAVLAPARVTVFHNGVLVHDNQEFTGPTAHKARPPYKAHADRLPLSLQDHDHPVRYRNIWIRPLPQ